MSENTPESERLDAAGRERAHDMIRSSELRYRRLFESAKDGILIIDADTGKIVDVNPFMTQLTSYTHDEFLGKHLWEIGPFKDYAASKAAFAELQSKEYIRYENLPLKTRDGREIQVEFISNVYRVEAQNVIQCNIRDITARKKTERALVESKGLFRVIFEESAIGKTLTSVDGRLLRVNEAFASMLGYRIDELVGRSFADVTHPDDMAGSDESAHVLLTGAAVQRFEKRYLRKDGGVVWVDANISAVRDATGKVLYFVSAFLDITERLRVHRELQDSKELLDTIVENVPLMIFLKDAQDLRFVVLNRAGEDLLGFQRRDLCPRCTVSSIRAAATSTSTANSATERRSESICRVSVQRS